MNAQDRIDLLRRHYPLGLFACRDFVLRNDKSKLPLKAGWAETVEPNWESVEAAVNNGAAVGYAIQPGVLVIDVDVPTDDKPNRSNGIESFLKLSKRYGLNGSGFVVETQTGSSHYYFSVPDDFRAVGALDSYPGLDFKGAGCYMVAAGSPHYLGGDYELTLDGKFSELPAELLEALRRKTPVASVENIQASAGPLTRILEVLPVEDYGDNDSWYSLLCSIHHGCGGDPEVLEKFVEWSRKDPAYDTPQNAESIRSRWLSLGTGDNPRTMASLIYDLGKRGYSGLADELRPAPNASEEFAALDEFELIVAADEEKAPCGFFGLKPSVLKVESEKPKEWIVDNVFSALQPTLFGGRSKSLKTTMLVDLAISLATGSPWLGEFPITKPRKTLLITGESNASSIGRLVGECLRSKGKHWEEIEESFAAETAAFPKLDGRSGALIRGTVETYGFGVVIVDPLYRALGSIDANKVGEVGEGLLRFFKDCQPATLIYAHHATKAAARSVGDDPPELEDMSGAGIAESAGNWWLIGRRESYNPETQQHDLVVNYGGRDRQGGKRRVTFDESRWGWECQRWGSFIDEQKAAKVESQDAAKILTDAEILLAIELDPDGLTCSQLAEATGFSTKR